MKHVKHTGYKLGMGQRLFLIILLATILLSFIPVLD